jgi:hypothetical protein
VSAIVQPARDQRVIDAEHLRLLSIFHFISAGLAFLGLLFLGVHYSFMYFVFSNADSWSKPGGGGPPPEELITFMKWTYILLGTWLLASFLGSLLSALFMRARRHRVFTIVVAGFECLYVPLGTLLGVFTIIVLSKESVRQLYDSPRS